MSKTLNDILEAHLQDIKAGHVDKLIANLEAWAIEQRIDELSKVPEDSDYFTAIKIHPYIKDRIANLRKALGKDDEQR